MSWGWYWKCNNCLPQKDFIKKYLAGITPEELEKNNLIDNADPYYHLEILSNRKIQSHRCKICDRWHINRKDNPWNEKQCSSNIPFEIPICKHCGATKQLFFKETFSDSLVFVKSAFCWPDGPPYISQTEVFDPYFFIGFRYEGDAIGQKILSAVYFNGKNAKNYGRYSPYFYLETFPLIEFEKWLEKEFKWENRIN